MRLYKIIGINCYYEVSYLILKLNVLYFIAAFKKMLQISFFIKLNGINYTVMFPQFITS